MTQPPNVAFFWVGPSLTPIARLSIASFIATGHKTTLYCYEKPKNIPEETAVAPAHDVLPLVPHLKPVLHKRPPLFSDIFRYHLLKKTNFAWADCDNISRKPLPNSPYLIPTSHDDELFGNILRLPQNSPALQLLISFANQKYPVPPWRPSLKRIHLNIRKTLGIGRPMHKISYNVLGPQALSYYLKQTNENQHASLAQVFNPIHFHQTHTFLLPWDVVEPCIPHATLSVHLFTNHPLYKTTAIPPNSWLARVAENLNLPLT